MDFRKCLDTHLFVIKIYYKGRCFNSADIEMIHTSQMFFDAFSLTGMQCACGSSGPLSRFLGLRIDSKSRSLHITGKTAAKRLRMGKTPPTCNTKSPFGGDTIQRRRRRRRRRIFSPAIFLSLFCRQLDTSRGVRPRHRHGNVILHPTRTSNEVLQVSR